VANGAEPVAVRGIRAAGTPLIVGKHRANIRRLVAGTEPKIGCGGERRADAPARPATRA
jgi:hypothetical protein